MTTAAGVIAVQPTGRVEEQQSSQVRKLGAEGYRPNLGTKCGPDGAG